MHLAPLRTRPDLLAFTPPPAATDPPAPTAPAPRAAPDSGFPAFAGLVDGVDAFVLGPGDAHPVDHDDIDQGDLSDCYLMAALATLAREDPDFVAGLVGKNRDGTYTVRLHTRDPHTGRLAPHLEIVDPRALASVGALPSGDGAGATREIWPLLFEKAFAQLRGGYHRIGNGGSPEEALEILTGREARGLPAAALAFDEIGSHLRLGRPITLLMRPDDGGSAERRQAAEGLGLVFWHTYAVVDVAVKEGIPLVKLYNPWDDDPALQPGRDRDNDGGWVPYRRVVATDVAVGWQVGGLQLWRRFAAASARD